LTFFIFFSYLFFNFYLVDFGLCGGKLKFDFPVNPVILSESLEGWDG